MIKHDMERMEYLARGLFWLGMTVEYCRGTLMYETIYLDTETQHRCR